MKNETPAFSFHGFWNEVQLVYRSAHQVWSLMAVWQKVILGLAAVLMMAVTACNISFPVLMGRLVDGVQNANEEDRTAIWHASLVILFWIAGIYLTREFLQIVRRAFVESACTGFEQQLSLRMIEHLMKADLAQLSQESIGSLHGRMTCSVVGTVRFVRLSECCGASDRNPTGVTRSRFTASTTVFQHWVSSTGQVSDRARI
jgi:ABC-type multidrug transport system fused ATPase/permease subunit